MKVEAWVFAIVALFLVPVTAIYWFMSKDPTGTAALILTFFLTLMIGGYVGLVARRMDPRPEDRRTGEIAEGAGEQGFFAPSSPWPFFLALSLVVFALGPVFGWWLLIIGVAFGFVTLTGLLYEFYRGDHAH